MFIFMHETKNVFRFSSLGNTLVQRPILMHINNILAVYKAHILLEHNPTQYQNLTTTNY